MREAPTLLLDIGSGTQDVLLHLPGEEPLNCPKFVLPSPARGVARRIMEAGEAGEGVYLHGRNMGGGFFRAMKALLDKGGRVAAHPEAALALGDSLDTVRSHGVEIAEERPSGCRPVHLTDYDPGFWRSFLGAAGLDLPAHVVACAQDHGFHPGSSNRLGRFELWRKLLTRDCGDLAGLVYRTPPKEMTRLIALSESIGRGVTADSGAAAVLGALYEEEVRNQAEERGVTIVNAGNSHTIAFLVHGRSVYGVFEHHTGMRDPKDLRDDLDRFRRGELTNQDVFDSGGHGCLTLDFPSGADFSATYLLGPRRDMLAGYAPFLHPGGDMMLAGCFGLLKGLDLMDG